MLFLFKIENAIKKLIWQTRISYLIYNFMFT